MLYFLVGSDRAKVRAAVGVYLQKERMQGVVRVTDAHTMGDMVAALQGGGMFGDKRVVIFENTCAHEEMKEALFDALATLQGSNDTYIIVEEKVDAATKKKIQKYAEKTDVFDAPKAARDNSAFDLANAFRRGDKKGLWVGYMRELAKGSAPEMLHGILFWAAKQFLLQSRGAATKKAEAYVIALAELPHEARRKGLDMEYALERFVLSVA